MRHMTAPEEFQLYEKVLELYFFHCLDFKMCTWPQASGTPQIRNGPMIGIPLLHHA
jgi:hypothetical protein